LGTANGATGATTDFSATTTLTKGTLNLATLNASSSLVVNGDTTLQADNSTFSIKTSAGASKFSVDSDNGNTIIEGTLAVTGITTLDDNLSIKANPSISAIVINADLDGAGEEANANIISVTRGAFGPSSFTWDEGSEKFALSHTLQGVGGLDVGSNLGAPTASISSLGDISTTTTLEVDGATTLNSDATLTTDASLLVQVATNPADPLILLNSNVNGAGVPAQNAVLAVKTGAATTATLTWVQADSEWVLSNNFEVAVDANIGQDLVVGRNLVVNGTAGDGTTLNGNTTIIGETKTFAIQDVNENTKFSVATDTGDTLIEGTLEVVGTSTLASGSTIGDITISDGLIETTAVDNNISFNDNNLTTSGNISTTGTGTLTVAGTLTADGDTILNENATITTDKALLIQAATADATNPLIILNSDVADGTGTPAQNAVALAVGTGVGTYTTFTWVQADSEWVLSNNLKVQDNLTIEGITTYTESVNITTAATNGITFRSEIAGGGLDGNATILRVNRGAEGFSDLSWNAGSDTFTLSDALEVTTGNLSVVAGDLIVGATFSLSNAGVISTAAEGHLLADITFNNGEMTTTNVAGFSFGDDDLTTTGDISATDIESTGTATLSVVNVSNSVTIKDGSLAFTDINDVQTFSIQSASGNTTIGGTLEVTGVTTLNNTLDLSDNDITDVHTLSVGVIEAQTNIIAVSLTDNQATSLQIAEGLNAYQTFVTTNGTEKVVFGKLIEAPASSVIANLTITNGNIDSATDAISFNDNNISTTGTADFGATTVDSLNVSEGNITNVGDIALDTISADASTIQVSMTDNQAGAFEVLQGANSYLKFDTTDGSELVTISKPLSITSTATLTGGVALNSLVVVNENGADLDFRVEGDNQTHLIFTDASTDRVGINNATPSVQLDVVGDTLITGVTTLNGGVVINETGADSDFRVEGDTQTHLLFVDASTDRVGIANNAPAKTLDVTGSVGVSNTLDVTGKTTLVGSLDLTTASSNGVTFRSEAVGNADATLVRVNKGGSFATISWDTNESFTVTDGLNSEGNFSVGVRDGDKVFTIASASGNTELSGVLSIKSADLAGDANNQSAVVLLNSDATALNAERDARIEVERGTATNSYLLWDESADSWVVSNKLNSEGEFSVGASKFIVASATGDTTVEGTLGVTGVVTAEAEGHTIADFTINNGEITSATATIDFVANNLLTTGSVTCTNMTVNGTLTTINSTDLEVSDSVIRLNKGASAAPNNTRDIGIFMERGSDEDDAVFFFDENDSVFKMGLTNVASTATDFTEPSTWGALKVGTLTTTSTITSSGVVNANGGLAVDTDKFTVDGATYKLATTGDVQITLNSATAFVVEKANGTDVLNINTADGTEAVTISSLLEPNAGIDVGASVFSVSNLGVTSILNTLNVKTGNTSAFVVEKADGTDVLAVDTTNNRVTFSGDLLLNKSLTDGIIFNADVTGAGAEDANLIKIERGDSADAVLSWDETRDEINLNSASGLHLVGKAAGLALSIGGANSANSPTTTITTAGVVTTDVVSLNKITNTDADGFIVEMADNQATGLVIRQGTGAGLDYVTLATTNGSELITLHQATSLSSTLSITGITTLSDSLYIKKSGSDTGVVFNSDRAVGDVPNGADFDAVLIHVEDGGAVGAVDAYLKWDDSEDSFKIEGGKLFSSTELSVGTEALGVLTKNFSVSTAGAVTSAGTIKTTGGVLAIDTPSQGAITFNSDSTGELDAHDFGITVVRPTAGEDAIFYWDEGTNNWTFTGAGNVEVQNDLLVGVALNSLLLSDGSITTANNSGISFGSDNLTTTGKTTTNTFEAVSTSEFKGAVTLSNVGFTINNAVPTAVFGVTNAGVTTIAGNLNANGGISVDTNKFVVADTTGNTSIQGTLTLTSTTGTTDLSIINNGSVVFEVDATNGNTNFTGTLITGGSITVQSGGLDITGTGTFKDNVTIATTKTLTLNQGVVNAAADVDAYIYVDRGTNTDTYLRWDEGVDRWMISNDGTNAYNVLHSNDTLVSINTYAIKQGSTNSFTIQSANAQEITVSGTGTDTLSIGLPDSVTITSDLTVGGIITGNGSIVKLSDPLLFLGLNNTTANHVGFYGQYREAGTNYIAGLVYQPSNDKFVLFGSETTIDSEGTTVTPSDSELASVDLSSVTAVVDLRVKSSSDNSSAKTSILLNSDQTGTPAATEDVTIEVERGDSTNAKLTWDEGEDRWMADNGTGTSYGVITAKASEGARYSCVEPTFVTNAYTLSAPTAYENKHAYFLNNGATAGTLNLFALSGSTYDGYVLQLINKGTNTITVDGNGTQTIAGELTKDIAAGATLSLIAYGTAWFII